MALSNWGFVSNRSENPSYCISRTVAGIGMSLVVGLRETIEGCQFSKSEGCTRSVVI